MGNKDWMNKYTMMDWWGMGFASFSMLAMLIIVIVFTVLLLRKLSADKSALAHITPMEILEERFARGEIDEDEFRKRRAELNG